MTTDQQTKKREMAEFEGRERTEKTEGEPTYKTEIKGEVIWLSQLKYDTSRDALWPVWEKFRDLDIVGIVAGHRHLLYVRGISHELLYGTPQSSFEKLSEGIRWYNNLKQ